MTAVVQFVRPAQLPSTVALVLAAGRPGADGDGLRPTAAGKGNMNQAMALIKRQAMGTVNVRFIVNPGRV